MEKFILALDQGTTSSRAIIFDHQGSIRSMGQKEFTQFYPKPGWVEHDALEIWKTQKEVANEAIQKAGLSKDQLIAIGITNQRETTIVWDRSTGNPIAPAIVWQDRRTADFCGELQKQGLSGLISQKTGLLIDAYFSGSKLKWILDHIPGARQQAGDGKLAFGTVDSWLVWNLTGGKVHVTDVSNASRTLLFNIHTLDWDEQLLQLMDIPRSMLPEVRSSSEIYGVSGDALLIPDIPISGIAGDQQSALFGQMCTRPGMVKNTYGTGCFLVMHAGEKPMLSQHNLLTTVAWKIGDKVSYALEGSIFIAGAVVQWLRDGLGMINHSSEVEQLAQSVPDNGGVYLVPAFAGLGAPHWDPHARGTMLGITRGTRAAHLARAALESMAYQTRDVLNAMEADSGIPIRELRVDGGASSNNMLMQFQADILEVPVVRPKVTETTALGAAYLAGLATGFWKNQEEIQEQWQLDRCFVPQMTPSKVHDLTAGWQRAVRAALSWAADKPA